MSNIETGQSYRSLWLLVAGVTVLVIGIVTVAMWPRDSSRVDSPPLIAKASIPGTVSTPAPGAASPNQSDQGGAAASPPPELVAIAGGTFWMGSDDDEKGREYDEGPLHQVSVSDFRLCRTEVTQGQWRAMMGKNPSYCENGCADDLPVHNVSWFDAIEYLNQLSEREGLTACYSRQDDVVKWDRACTGYRLPTEAEWEYAARAGTATAYSTGSNPTGMSEFAWYEDNAEVRVHPVASKPGNAWGLHDMHGNVYEWVWDWHGPYSGEAQRDPAGPDQGRMRVARGGSFVSWSKNLRYADRFGVVPTPRSGRGLGLRCARNATGG